MQHWIYFKRFSINYVLHLLNHTICLIYEIFPKSFKLVIDLEANHFNIIFPLIFFSFLSFFYFSLVQPQGILLADPNATTPQLKLRFIESQANESKNEEKMLPEWDSSNYKDGLCRLWLHEILRVFSDRLIDTSDHSWFVQAAQVTFNNHFQSAIGKVN